MFSIAARRALDRRTAVLARDLPLAIALDAEALHRARVASRRLRAFLALLEPAGETAGLKRWRKAERRVRRITRALGGVRELDVSLALLAELVGRHPEATSAVISARAIIDDIREERLTAMLAKLAALDLEKLTARLTGLLTERRTVGTAAARPDLRAQLLASTRRLVDAARDAGALYALDRLHQLRIAVKKLRYTLELVEELERVGTRRLVGRLRHLQDLLGRMHDLDVLAGYIRKVGTGRAADRRAVARLLHVVDTEIRELHAVYLANRRLLRSVVDDCRSSLPDRIQARAASRRRIAAPNG